MISRSRYGDADWKKIRLVILARDGYRCQIQGPKCKNRANHVDHIVNIDDGGARLDPANLRASCGSCNISKRNTEVAARARRARTMPPAETNTPTTSRDWNAPRVKPPPPPPPPRPAPVRSWDDDDDPSWTPWPW